MISLKSSKMAMRILEKMRLLTLALPMCSNMIIQDCFVGDGGEGGKREKEKAN